MFSASVTTKMAIALSLMLVTLFVSEPVSATTYYVASDGSDGNNGHSAVTPWQTITKVNSMMSGFNSGDQILFRKGDKFIGQIYITKSGTAGNEIIFGSYGTGALPEITGKKPITSWTVHSGNIYKANFTDTVSHLYVSDKIMTIARYPNSGFLKIDNGAGTGGFHDAALTQGAGYWNGATCRIRTVNWAYEIRTVSNFSSGNITFSSPTANPTYDKYGYYFDNKLTLLDAPGEWFQDKVTKVVYLYAPGGVDPNTLNVEGVALKIGISGYYARTFIKIQDLKLSGYNNAGIELLGANNITVQRCYVNHNQKYGFVFTGSNNLIDNNVMEDNLNIVISGVYTNSVIKNNNINRTGIIPGYGDNAWGYLAMQIYSSFGTIVEYNTIDSTGYTALTAGKDMIVRNNLISYSCIVLNDGAGIDVNDADGVKILNNIITNTIGSVETSRDLTRFGMGIYFGAQLTKNILIQGNTLANNSYAGINVDNKSTTENNQIYDNVLYNNAYTQLVFTDLSASSYTPVYSNLIKRNVFYCLNFQQTCIEQQMFHSSSFSDFGNFDSNYYCNPYSEYVLRRSKVFGTYSTKYYRLSSWKQLFNEDLASKYSQFSFDQYKVIDTVSSNLITNSTFSTVIAPWSTTPAAGSTITHTINPLLDSGCMRIRWNGTGGTEGMTSGNYVNILKGNYYFLSFSCAGNHPGDFSTFGRPVAGGNPFLYARRHLAYDPFKRNYSFVFKPDTSDASTRVAFALSLPDSLLFIDNVKLYQVTVERIDSTQMSKLFINETNSPQSISLGGVAYKDYDGNPVIGSVLLQPYSSQVLIRDNPDLSKNLNLTALVQGFYDPASNSMQKDTLKVYLRNTNSPYAIVDSAKSSVDSLGNGVFNFTNALNGVNYYINVRHRNSVETWSSGYAYFVSNQAVYNFTISSSQAYGNNQILKGSRYCFYNGDLNQDGVIDAIDVSAIDNHASVNLTGYVDSDLDGNDVVDGSDMLIADNNAFNFIGKIAP